MQIKILIASEDFSYGSLGLSYYNAFKQAGCDVNQFDLIQEYGSINPFANNKYIDKLFGGLFYRHLNENLLKIINLLKPDLIFIIKGSFIFSETIREIKKINHTLVFNFNPDNPFNLNPAASNNLIRGSIPYYDCYFIWGKFLLPQIKSTGVKFVEYLPFAYDPTLHYPVKVTDEEKKVYGSDIAFIGSWDKEREQWLENLLDYDLAIWGNAWNKLKNGSLLKQKWKRRAALGEDFAKICSASKIILNLVREQNGNAHNMRTFEVPACKGFMLTTRTKEQGELFEEGRGIACFETPRELKMKIDEFLKNENAIRGFKIEANKKVQPHTYYERAEKILEVFRELDSSL